MRLRPGRFGEARLRPLHRGWARRCHICTGTWLTPATFAPGLGSPSHHIYTGTGRAAATPAPGLGSPLPHLRRDWARPPALPHLHCLGPDRAHAAHICAGTRLRVGPVATAVAQADLAVRSLPMRALRVPDASTQSTRVGPVALLRRQSFLFGLCNVSGAGLQYHPVGLKHEPLFSPFIPLFSTFILLSYIHTAILYIHTLILYIHTLILYIRCTASEQRSALPKLVLAR